MNAPPAARRCGTGCWARPKHRAGSARPAGPAGRHRSAVPVAAGIPRLGQRVLRRRRAGRHAELEGAAVRLAGRRQRDHGGQAAGRDVGDGPVGPAVRVQLLEHAGAAGADGRCGGGAAVCRGAPYQWPGCGSAGGLRPGADARGGVDVPVQQPRRPPGAAAGGRRLLRGAGVAERTLHPLDRAVRHRNRLRLPGQAAAGIPGAAGAGPGGSRRDAGKLLEAAARSSRRAGRRRGLGWVVRGTGQPVARGLAALHRRFHRQQPVGVGAGLQRSGPRPGRRRQPDQRFRRTRRWRWPWRFDVRRQCRHHPDVRRVDGHRDLLAAAGRADRPDRRTVVHPACAAHQPQPGGPAAVGWLDGGDGRGVQLHEGHHAPLLHDRPGPRRGRGGWRSRWPNSGAAGSTRPAGSGWA